MYMMATNVLNSNHCIQGLQSFLSPKQSFSSFNTLPLKLSLEIFNTYYQTHTQTHTHTHTYSTVFLICGGKRDYSLSLSRSVSLCLALSLTSSKF